MRARMPAKGNHAAHKQDNLYGRKYIMCAKANTARALPNRFIAIGLSKARRAGVKLAAPGKGKASSSTKAARDYRKGRSHPRRRSRAMMAALKKEGARPLPVRSPNKRVPFRANAVQMLGTTRR